MKERILQELRKIPDEYVSGEGLSTSLGVTRTAVWKHINELKKEGYIIESSSRKGYKFISADDIYNAYEIGYKLDTKVLGKNIQYFNEINSTNSYAKKIAYEGCPEGTVVVSDSQTSGRGRLGREWSSAEGKGIWMSVVLRSHIAPENVQIMTLAASIAVVDAIKKTTGICTGIKWPNDIILDGKKVCGILTEMSSEIDRVNFLVLGIGLNVNHDHNDFSEELGELATSLKIYAGKNSNHFNHLTPGFNRCNLIKNILFELEQKYSRITNGLTTEIIEEWKKYSITLGKQIRVIARDNQITGIASDITHEGKLVVSSSDGVRHEISSGEISVRGMMGYI